MGARPPGPNPPCKPNPLPGHELENRFRVRQATLVPLVPLDPPTLIISVIMSPEENPPLGAKGPPPTVPDRPVTPNVIGAEAIPDGSVMSPLTVNMLDP